MGKTISGTTTQFLGACPECSRRDGLIPVQELDGASTPNITANVLTGLKMGEYFSRTDSSVCRIRNNLRLFGIKQPKFFKRLFQSQLGDGVVDHDSCPSIWDFTGFVSLAVRRWTPWRFDFSTGSLDGGFV
jgi:hypothetical protein